MKGLPRAVVCGAGLGVVWRSCACGNESVAQPGCVVPCAAGTGTCVRLCSSICRRRRVVRLQRARKGESRRASSACRYLPGQPMHPELHCTAVRSRYRDAAMCCIWGQTELSALPPGDCPMTHLHAEMLCLGKGHTTLAIDHCGSPHDTCMFLTITPSPLPLFTQTCSSLTCLTGAST